MLPDDQNQSPALPRILIVGAGSRGNAYARAVSESGQGIVAAVAEPIAFKRNLLGSKYIWGSKNSPSDGQEFEDWRAFLQWETNRRTDAAAGRQVPPGIDGIFICILDEQHAEVITALGHLAIHTLCEKPLATTLKDCLAISSAMSSQQGGQSAIFGIGHVLRYSPHNMLLRKLVLEDQIIGPILSVEHTEPVGNWHFSHSYVRGNWRKESTTAPSLLTKSCHDIDFLLWMLCSPPPGTNHPPHVPASVASFGSLKQFQQSRKPASAGTATNCLRCPIEKTCTYSAPRIYYNNQLAKGNTDWPVNIVNPEIEACYNDHGKEAAKEMLFKTLEIDYDESTSPEEIHKRPWFGRCVWESENDVCDDQFVLLSWNDDPLPGTANAGLPCPEGNDPPARMAKTASFHMIAQTEKQCERRGRIYGEKGEISYDGTLITIYDFSTGQFQHHHPHRPGGGHGGGDYGLATQFLKAINAVKSKEMSIEEAQTTHLGCTLEEVIRSHALVFAAEEARLENKVVDWQQWWDKVNVAADASTSETPHINAQQS
ncbi:streptomycin biosynthesis protein StrI [Aureobasidium pullulans]|uniref:Streptomycin biosynthesis protein StrI n=1 Tax=Aureobasidium pullulans TaxID=5580 RepID=A0A4S9D0W6_AURPU|nr:streptomycin biosynthesis protein StrI [Aureobasidium pullulans]